MGAASDESMESIDGTVAPPHALVQTPSSNAASSSPAAKVRDTAPGKNESVLSVARLSTASRLRSPPPSPSRAAPPPPPAVQELLLLRQLIDKGTPLTSLQAKRAEGLVAEAVSEGYSIGTNASYEFDAKRLRLSNEQLVLLGLDAPEKPTLPGNILSLPLQKRLVAVQKCIEQLTYNHVGTGTNFNIDKTRNLGRILETARQIERDALPVRCVEAVFVALRWTRDWTDVDRIPGGFKTEVSFIDGKGVRRAKTHRHIVLFVRRKRESGGNGNQPSVSCDTDNYESSTYGALGISRRATLGFRPMEFASITDILTSYKRAYAEVGHEVTKVRVGLPVPRDPPDAMVCWRHLCVSVGQETDTEGDDDDDDEDEEDTESGTHPGAVKREDDDETTKETWSSSVKTWHQACDLFERHCSASKSRRLFDAWRVDGLRFKVTEKVETKVQVGKTGKTGDTTGKAVQAKGKSEGNKAVSPKPKASQELEKQTTTEEKAKSETPIESDAGVDDDPPETVT